ncbi:MAG: nucleoside hydrolase [Leadbetterella sp.]
MKKIVFILSLLTQFTYGQKVNLIFDSDIGPDYDDVGAVAVMHSLADSGKVNILATIACNKHKYIVPVLSTLNTYFKRKDIPIGIVKGKAPTLKSGQKWDSLIVAKYPQSFKSNDQATDAVKLYRKVLASQSDLSVTICTVGFLTNLADLLESKPDKISKLTGLELVRKKVKLLVSMAAKFPEGKEYNVMCDPISAKIVAENWPSPIIFSGQEVGSQIFTGLELSKNENVQNSPIKDVYAKCIPLNIKDANGRMSWDQTAVLVAIQGAEPYFSLVEGRIKVDEMGGNKWLPNGKGHFYLKEKMPYTEVGKVIEGLMMR